MFFDKESADSAQHKALEGLPPQKIAESLNQRAILTSKGNYWSNVTIQRLLIDETHLGKIISNKTQGDAHKNKRPNSKEYKILPKSEWVVVENCHESVKTLEEHEQILTIINQRKKIPVKNRKQTHALTGLVKCAKCGHSHILHTVDGKPYIKPCWYIDKLGNKCRNRGILSDTLEKIVLKEISKYKEEFIKCTYITDKRIYDKIMTALHANEALLSKYQKALDIVNDAYDLGDYDREECTKRKEKWQKSIDQTNIEIYELKKQFQAFQQKSNEDRIDYLSIFFKHISIETDSIQRNTLYKTIIDNIIYLHDGDNINVKINFK